MKNDQVWAAIERFARDHSMSCSGLARCSGLDPTTFNKSKRQSKYGQPRWPTLDTVNKIITTTRTTFSEFAKYIDGQHGYDGN